MVIELGFQLAFGGLLRSPVPVNGDAQFTGKGGQASYVIAVLVGYQDAGEGFGNAADEAETLTDLASAEARVNEEPGFPALKIRTISITPATQDRQLN